MDSSGRLHMPGFVGKTYEETGVLEEREGVPEASTENRHERRKREAMERLQSKLAKAVARTP